MTTVLDEQADVITIINTFDTAPERAEELLRELSEATVNIYSKQPGFVSANFHVAKDKSCVINYAQWRDMDAVRAMMEDPGIRGSMKVTHEIAKQISPVFCDLRATFGPSA